MTGVKSSLDLGLNQTAEPRSDKKRWTQSESRFKILFIVIQQKHQRCSVERNYEHGSINNTDKVKLKKRHSIKVNQSESIILKDLDLRNNDGTLRQNCHQDKMSR